MPPGNDGEAGYVRESERLSNRNDATGFAVTSHPKLSSVFPSRKYVAVGSETEDLSPQTPKHAEPFQVELLSDVEGSSSPRKFKLDGGDGERWMQDIWAVPNRAVVMSYFCVGFSMKFLMTPLSYYMVNDLEAEPSQQNVVWTLAALPWSFKLVYGFISDNFPICGMRRKPYFILGWGTFVAVYLKIASADGPSVQMLAGGMFVATVGFMFSDVATDAIMVERSKREGSQNQGHMQAIAYSVRFVGSLLGSVMGMALYNKESWGWGLTIHQCFLLSALFPVLFIGPWVYQLRETTIESTGTTSVVQRVQAQCKDVFQALEQKAVYEPMFVVFVYNLFQVPNAAWRSFLVEGLGFQAQQLGILGIVASLMSTVGLLVYRKFFFRTSWRKIYVWSTLLVTFFSTIQLLLIFRINLMLGISDLVFSIGDDSIADVIVMIQFLPIVQMYLSMCPDGAEGTTYAILTTMSNVAGAASYSLGTSFTKLWDVRNNTLRAGNFDGIWKLTLLTSLIQPLPLLLIWKLPANQAEQRALQTSGIRKAWGGAALLIVLLASLFWTILQAVLELSN